MYCIAVFVQTVFLKNQKTSKSTTVQKLPKTHLILRWPFDAESFAAYCVKISSKCDFKHPRYHQKTEKSKNQLRSYGTYKVEVVRKMSGMSRPLICFLNQVNRFVTFWVIDKKRKLQSGLLARYEEFTTGLWRIVYPHSIFWASSVKKKWSLTNFELRITVRLRRSIPCPNRSPVHSVIKSIWPFFESSIFAKTWPWEHINLTHFPGEFRNAVSNHGFAMKKYPLGSFLHLQQTISLASNGHFRSVA